jgi:hypothetical protein
MSNASSALFIPKEKLEDIILMALVGDDAGLCSSLTRPPGRASRLVASVG